MFKKLLLVMSLLFTFSCEDNIVAYVDEETSMKLWLDGEELFRNVPENARILEKGEKQFGEIRVKYVIMTPNKPVETEEARGLQIRLRDVAIGFPTNFDVIKFTGKVPGKLNYLCGEVHILSGLESALMIDRDSFSYTQRVAEVQEFFRRKLNNWNDTLEKWARSDKVLYELLQDLSKPEKIIKELKKADILHLSKDRLRISKSPIITTKKKDVSPLPERIKETLMKMPDYNVISEKGEVSPKVSPIKVIPKTKTIVIYEDHLDFIEEMTVEGNKYKVTYDEWEPKETVYSICKLIDKQKKVVFNKNHPLFKSKLSEEIVKKLSLGFVFIAKNRNDEEELISKLNHLIEDIFLV